MKVTIEVKLTPKQIAEAIAGLDDEGQAQVFIDLAEIAKDWKDSGMQWFSVGRHLRDCSCSTYEARSLVEGIAGGMQE